MVYAAAFSLKRVLDQLFHYSDEFANLHCPDSYIIRLWQMAKSILAFDFKENHPKSLDLEKEIRDALCKAEDIVESYLLSQFFPSESEGSEDILSDHASNFSENLVVVIQDLESAKERMDKFVDDLKNGREDSISVAASTANFSTITDSSLMCKTKMVGLDRELEQIKRIVLGEPRQDLGAAVIYGMGGIGKTSLAKSFYVDLGVRNHFSIGAWVKISLEHCVRDILLSLLRTVEEFDGQERHEKMFKYEKLDEIDDDELTNLVREIFAPQRYLVVVDCLCEMNETSWNYIKSLLPDSINGSRIILVNRMRFWEDEFILCCHRKHFLDASKSWDLLKEQLYGDDPCPRGLEKVGKRIAKNCQGLPLAITTVGLHLAKEPKTVEYWNKVAESGNSIAYAVDGAPMFQQLGLSYERLPQRLKPFFLYLGAFPESREIPFLDVANLWAAEVFLGEEDFGTFRNLIGNWIKHFYDRNLVVSKYAGFSNFSCYLHHAMWYFCCNKAQEDELFHVIDKCNELEDLNNNNRNKNVRRLVIRNNVLFGICKLEDQLPTIRSLLLTGAYHPYPLAQILWSSYKMLGVLNAATIRFYEFPAEILCLTLLRYLSMTLNRGNLPPEISKLTNLQFLVVRLNQIVRSLGGLPTYLPMQIWEMQKLMHLQVEGSDLPVPTLSDARLPNLLVLLDVSHHSCKEEVFERIPHLMQLGIMFNLPPTNDAGAPKAHPFHHLVLPKKLQILECTVANPYFERYPGTRVVAFPMSLKFSMDTLTSLNLTACGFSWKSTKYISWLPFLVLLRLKCHAFRGPKWELTNKGFRRLRTLILEELDLVHWVATSGDHLFPRLRNLMIRGCHKLQQISLDLVHFPDLRTIEVADSSSASETWARSIQMERPLTGQLLINITSPRGTSTNSN